MKTKIEEVRPANTIMFLDELTIDNRTFNNVSRNLKSLDEAVLVGRFVAYDLENNPNADHPIWKMSLARALDDAGLIRHDLDKKSFLVGELYSAIGTFAEPKDIFKDNKKYELFRNLTASQLAKVHSALEDRLSGRELLVILRRFGLENGEKWSRAELASEFGCSSERVRQMELKAIKKLRNFNQLPPFWGPIYSAFEAN